MLPAAWDGPLQLARLIGPFIDGRVSFEIDPLARIGDRLPGFRGRELHGKWQSLTKGYLPQEERNRFACREAKPREHGLGVAFELRLNARANGFCLCYVYKPSWSHCSIFGLQCDTG